MNEGEGESGSETGGETSSSNLDARRCYSMGSYEYVVGETNLRVPLIHLRDLQDLKFVKKTSNGLRIIRLMKILKGKR
ncbi:hypothetical protein HanIR_Chr14g0718821 [Helianthus annuus]|nr:hypothetical protein HanIR_Chr14g0718821 [Helianthus annuus]